MAKIIIMFFLSLTFFAQTLTVQSPIRFLALGDSYTIGQNVAANKSWPAQLVDSLNARGIVTDTMRIIATTGWRTDNLLNAIINKQLEQQHYNLVSVLIGVNNQYQNKPISQYMSEFPQLLDSAIHYAGGDTSHVFIVSIPDYAATPFGQEASPSQISQEIDQYNLINKNFADSYHIKYFDITPISRFGLFQPYLVANDGLHPSEVQYSEWVKLMLQGNLLSVFEDLTAKKMKVFPNPASDNITISYPVRIKKTLELYNATGTLILKRDMNDESIDISLKDLSKGIYVVRIAYNDQQFIKAIIKQ